MSADYSPMTAQAQRKAQQILEGLAHQDAPQIMATCCALLAMLTSAMKDDRESAKRRIRELVLIGRQRLQAKQDAADLASFANRHEP